MQLSGQLVCDGRFARATITVDGGDEPNDAAFTLLEESGTSDDKNERTINFSYRCRGPCMHLVGKTGTVLRLKIDRDSVSVKGAHFGAANVALPADELTLDVRPDRSSTSPVLGLFVVAV